MSIKKLLCLGIAAAVVCTAVPVTAPVQEVQAETNEVKNNQDFQIEDGVLKKYLGEGGDVIIPESVTSIGDSAFSGCSGLKSVTLPEGITDIGENAFSYCGSLTDIIIPDGVISIGDGAFYECSDLKSIIIPKSVSSIGKRAFGGYPGELTKLEVDSDNVMYSSVDGMLYDKNKETLIRCFGEKTGSVAIPEGVKSIEEFAFENCRRLTDISIPKSVTSIGRLAFYFCSRMAKIEVALDNTAYLSENGILYNKNRTTLICCPGGKAGSIIIPEGVGSITESAFESCWNLRTVKIPESMTKIERSAFYGCDGLVSIIIPEGVTDIEGGAFNGCEELTIYGKEGSAMQTYATENNIRFSTGKPGETDIKDGVLVKYTGMDTDVVIPTGVTSIGDRAFYECRGLTSVTIPEGVTTIGNQAFQGCRELEHITIPEGVTTIGYSAFQGCSNLESIIIPEGVTSIGADTFSGYEDGEERMKLKNVIIPESVTNIGDYAFYLCSELESVIIPGGVTTIGDYAFSGCGLSSITIPSSVTDIGMSAFSHCSRLASIKVEEENLKYDSRGNCNAIIHTESSTLEWGCKNTVIPEGVMSIGQDAFWGCSEMKSIIIPEGVSYIEELAFCDCSGLESMEIPNSVIGIGGHAFWRCTGMKSIIIPESVTSIEENAFEDCNDELVIYGKTGSYAETYATENNIKFVSTGEISKPVEKKELSDEDITISQTSYVYDGEAKTPTVTVKHGDETLTRDIDYTVTYQDNVNAGTAKVIVTGMGNYTGTVTKTFTITQNQEVKEISECTITLSQTSYTYDGKIKTPSVTVKLDGKILTLNTDYTVSYSDNINAGTAKVTVTGKGNFTGSKTVNFTIAVGVADISKATVTLDKTSYNYDGKAKTPSVTVKLDGKTLTPNTDYTVSYSDNINAGTAKVTVTGKGNYTGSKTVNFTIAKAGQDSSITCKKTLYKVAYGTKPFKINAASKSKLTFTSSKPKIVSVDKDTGKVTIKNTGVAIITIKAGKDSVKVTVKVSPKKQAVKSVNVSKGKKLTVKWAKDKTASGYQVQVSIDKKFKKGVKSKNLSKTSYTFTKLKAGKKYYVRMRSYKKSGKETLYSTWSKTKTSNKVKK